MAASALTLVLALVLAAQLNAQSSVTLQERVFDSSRAALRSATVSLRNSSTRFDRSVTTDDEGRYHIEAIPAGAYDVIAAANGFKSALTSLTLDVGRTVVRDVRLDVGDASETVTVVAETPLVDRVTTSVGHLLTSETVEDLPLNGSVAPSQAGFSTTPARGVDAVAISTAGNREEGTGFLVNGVSTSNLTFGSLGYKTTIVITASVLLTQSLLIAGLMFERSRRRKAETECRRSMVALAHLNRRAAMGELATSLAHELNQPLNAILQNAGVAQIMLNTQPLPPALGEMPDVISDIRNEDIRASQIIRRMRALLQKHEFEAHPVDLNELARETVAIVEPEAKSRDIQLETALTDDARPILGDRVHLQQVLLNVLMNAMDAVATMAPGRRRIRVATTHTHSEVHLTVSDTGVGIAADRISEIFEPFYTTKGDGSGMGMGLAIARSIVDAHDGHITAANNPAGGATMSLSLPVPSSQEVLGGGSSYLRSLIGGQSH